MEFEPLEGIAVSSVISQDLYVLNCCLFAAELINSLTKEYDPHPGLFDMLIAFLRQVGNQKEPGQSRPLARLILFQLGLLKEIGLSPIFDYCVNCNCPFSINWPEIYFSVNAKGLICRDCQGAFPDKIKITQQTAKCLVDANTLLSANDKIVKLAENIIIHYITDILGRTPKMAKYILQK